MGDWAHGKHQGEGRRGLIRLGEKAGETQMTVTTLSPAQRVCGLFRSVPARKFPARTGDKCRNNIKNIEQPVLYWQETEQDGWSLSLLEPRVSMDINL